MKYKRNTVSELVGNLKETPAFIHILTGPRQIGKTTVAVDVQNSLGWPTIFEAADYYPTPGPEWIETQWARARALSGPHRLLVLDEIQKVRGWSETVKRLWDEDRRKQFSLSVLLLGSSALLLHLGMGESLAGRFLHHRCMHWTLSECASAFGWSLEQWLYFGGYPGAAAFAHNEAQWCRYVSDALIETAIARDILQLQPVNKPALLRELFGVAATHPAQIFSYNKMLGQLNEAGNTTTLAHYLELLDTAYLASGLSQYSGNHARKRASSPKLILWNNALINAFSRRSPEHSKADGAWWGRLVENAVGAHLLNYLPRETHSVHYWRQGNDEVDFVVSSGRSVWAIEVKSGRPGRTAGLQAFLARYPKARALIVGTGGIPLLDFFSSPPAQWFP
jgi:uncharacterized protein